MPSATGVSYDPVGEAFERENFRKFEKILGAEVIDDQNCLNPAHNETDQIEDPLKQQIEENFISIKASVERQIKIQ